AAQIRSAGSVDGGRLGCIEGKDEPDTAVPKVRTRVGKEQGIRRGVRTAASAAAVNRNDQVVGGIIELQRDVPNVGRRIGPTLLRGIVEETDLARIGYWAGHRWYIAYIYDVVLVSVTCGALGTIGTHRAVNQSVGQKRGIPTPRGTGLDKAAGAGAIA